MGICFLLANTLGTRGDINKRERKRETVCPDVSSVSRSTRGGLREGRGTEGRGEPDPGDPEDRRPSEPNFCIRSRRLGCLLIVFMRVRLFFLSEGGFVLAVFCDAECSVVLFPEDQEGL